jgi:hypothetical protein
MADITDIVVTRGDVIKSALEWLELRNASYNNPWDDEASPIILAVTKLAEERANDMLIQYAKQLDDKKDKHEQMLDTIEELLQTNIQDLKNDNSVELLD